MLTAGILLADTKRPTKHNHAYRRGEARGEHLPCGQGEARGYVCPMPPECLRPQTVLANTCIMHPETAQIKSADMV